MKKKVFSLMAVVMFASSSLNLSATSVSPRVDCIGLAFEVDAINPMT